MSGPSRPVTLDDLARENKLLWVYCRDCGHERDVEPRDLPVPDDTPVPQVGKRLKCSLCGSRKISTAPELYPGGIRAMRAKRLQQ